MITLNDIRTTVASYIPYDKGFMFLHANRYTEDATKYSITYDGNVVPYIQWQEYGFTHYITRQRVEVNKGFIQNDTVNALDFLINQASANEKSLIMADRKQTVQARARMISQGTLESLQGNKNR